MISLHYRAYFLAKQLSAISFKTALIDVIFDKSSHCIPRSPEVKYLFFCLPEEDPVLQFLVDTFCINNGVANMNVEDFDEIEAMPKEYFVRTLRKLHQLSDMREKVIARGGYIMMLFVRCMGMAKSSITPVADEAKDSKAVEIKPSATKEAPTNWEECEVWLYSNNEAWKVWDEYKA